MRRVGGLSLRFIAGCSLLVIGCALGRERRSEPTADSGGWVRLCRVSVDSRRGALFHQASGAFVELESGREGQASAWQAVEGDEVTRGTQGNVQYVAIRAADARGRAQREYKRGLGSVPDEPAGGPTLLPPPGCAFQGATFSPADHVLNVSAALCDQAQESATRMLVFSDEFPRDAQWIAKECARRGAQWTDVQALGRQTPLTTAIQRLGQPTEVWRSGKNSVTLAYRLSDGGGAQLTFDPTGLLDTTRTK
jgi:hypothetical protein